MSRARNIKPGFFKNEILVELPFEQRLLFIGLWTMADREGRFEDRPTRIKMELFPADAIDVDAGLQALHDRGFLLRYEADGKRFCQILAWSKHQNPHPREVASSIPEPCKGNAKAMPRTDQGNDEDLSSRAGSSDSLPLIPDSLEKKHSRTVKVQEPTDAGRACLLMRKAGCIQVNPSHPDLLAALAEGVTPETLADTAGEGIATGKTSPFPWAIATARSRHAEGARAPPNSILQPRTGAMGKTAMAMHMIEAMKDGRRGAQPDSIEAPTLVVLEPGRAASG